MAHAWLGLRNQHLFVECFRFLDDYRLSRNDDRLHAAIGIAALIARIAAILIIAAGASAARLIIPVPCVTHTGVFRAINRCSRGGACDCTDNRTNSPVTSTGYAISNSPADYTANGGTAQSIVAATAAHHVVIGPPLRCVAWCRTVIGDAMTLTTQRAALMARAMLIDFIHAFETAAIIRPFALNPTAMPAILALAQRAIVAADIDVMILTAAVLRLNNDYPTLSTGLLGISRVSPPSAGRGSGQ